MPRVSVVLASLNPEEYLCDALDSVLSQSFTDFELILCDDGAAASSWSAMSGYSDQRIKVLRGDAIRGTQFVGVEDASEVAAGEYIVFRHPGDLWVSDNLEKQVVYLDAHPDTAAIFAWVEMPNRDGHQAGRTWHHDENNSRSEWLRHLFLAQDHFHLASQLIRRACYQDVGGYRHGLGQTADAELLSRILIKYPVHFIQEKPTGHRKIAGSQNASLDRVEVAIRDGNERNVLRENYLSIASFDEIVAIFPSLDRFRRASGWDIQFLLAMACLYECNRREAWQLGLRWLFGLIDDKARYRRIRDLYSFSHLDFVELAAEFDVYFIRGAQLIAEWDSRGGKLWEGLIADRDWLVGQRQWLLGQRDWLAAERDWLAAERERLIDGQNTAINDIYRSSSWRLTRPIRSMVRFARAQRSSLGRLLKRPQILSLSPDVSSDARGAAPSDASCDALGDAPADPPSAAPIGAAAPQVSAGRDILLVVHEFSRTGAPYAALSLARALSSLRGVQPVVGSPVDGPIRGEFEREGFSTVVDPSLLCGADGSSEISGFVRSFDRVIVNSLGAFGFIDHFKGIANRLTWWIHETDVGFTTVAALADDVSSLFSACESIWLGSPLCFPLAARYASQDKLHLLLYGCSDRVTRHRPHRSGKIVLSIIGSVERRKGQDVFLEAIERLPNELRCKAIFRIIGSPLPNNDESVGFFLKVRTKAALSPEVRCFNSMPSERLQELYAESNVLVSASRDDPMPIVITEGLMLSKVCLCSSAIGHAQLLEDGKDGLIFASESAEELAQKMAWILENPAELTALGTAGRAVYERHFLVSNFVKNVAKLLQEEA